MLGVRLSVRLGVRLGARLGVRLGVELCVRLGIRLVFRLGHGLLNRWTDIFILPLPAWGPSFYLNNGTETHSIFLKL